MLQFDQRSGREGVIATFICALRICRFCPANCLVLANESASEFRHEISPAIAALLAVALIFPSKAFSAKSKKHSPTPAPDLSDHITAVHLTSIIINVYATQSSKEFKVTPATKITVNGQPSRLDGLATGMTVRVTSALDGATAVSIDAKSPKR